MKGDPIMVKLYKLGIYALLGLMTLTGLVMANPPHTGTYVGCVNCHTLHNAAGDSLTNVAGNANLCMSCHVSGGVARKKPFSSSMQADIGALQTSHSWSGVMPNLANDQGSANSYGLRTDDQVSDTDLKTRLGKIGTCSNGIDHKKADCESIGKCSKTAFLDEVSCVANAGVWTPHTQAVWTASVVCSTCHAVMSQAKTPWDPSWTTVTKHFMRSNNDLNQMCVDCHYYSVNTSNDVKVYDGTRKNHPIVKNLTSDVSNPARFIGAAPYEPNCKGAACAQTGSPRYHQNGGSDTNTTNNIVFDAQGKIRCLSCHGVHYTDSNSTTVDQP